MTLCMLLTCFGEAVSRLNKTNLQSQLLDSSFRRAVVVWMMTMLYILYYNSWQTAGCTAGAIRCWDTNAYIVHPRLLWSGESCRRLVASIHRSGGVGCFLELETEKKEKLWAVKQQQETSETNLWGSWWEARRALLSPYRPLAPTHVHWKWGHESSQTPQD